MMSATLFGPPLPKGGTIGVAAPASPYDARSEILRGVEWWESQGYRVKLAEGVFARDDYVAGEPERRAADLVSLFADPEVDVVQCLQGGYGSAQAIPHIDFDVVATSPKPFVGYSDITALHAAVQRGAVPFEDRPHVLESTPGLRSRMTSARATATASAIQPPP